MLEAFVESRSCRTLHCEDNFAVSVTRLNIAKGIRSLLQAETSVDRWQQLPGSKKLREREQVRLVGFRSHELDLLARSF